MSTDYEIDGHELRLIRSKPNEASTRYAHNGQIGGQTLLYSPRCSQSEMQDGWAKQQISKSHCRSNCTPKRKMSLPTDPPHVYQTSLAARGSQPPASRPSQSSDFSLDSWPTTDEELSLPVIQSLHLGAEDCEDVCAPSGKCEKSSEDSRRDQTRGLHSTVFRCNGTLTVAPAASICRPC